MKIDHSTTYSKNNLVNIFHKDRLKHILRILEGYNYDSLGDFGCSNGYLTNLLKKRLLINDVTGFDHSYSNIQSASSRFEDITFEHFDLNVLQSLDRSYELVTCFETLEHVGNIQNGIDNLIMTCAKGGRILISVPNEKSIWGLLKVLHKYNDIRKFQELHVGRLQYVKLILLNDIKKLRETLHVTSYSSHFGFDYTVIDDYLVKRKLQYRRTKKLSTVFYDIRK
jgi:2-polyprenyl-3-methyl-5-hydroxy-6-metoxy-1,4-benzoquinol methylase